MQYEVNFFRVDTVAIDAATESTTDTITHRAGYKTSKDSKRTKWAWHKITDGDLQNARQAIQRFKSANFPKRVAVEELRQEFNPYSGFVSAFLQRLLEYPRIQIYMRDIPHHVEIGGAEYIDADTPPDSEYLCKGGFYDQCTAFKNFVAWVGNKANCNRAAQVVIAIDNHRDTVTLRQKGAVEPELATASPVIAVNGSAADYPDSILSAEMNRSGNISTGMAKRSMDDNPSSEFV